MIKVAFVGAGRMAACHAAILKDLPEVRLHGVYDPAAETVKSFAEKFQIGNIYPCFEQLVADREIDAVLVCNFTDQHYETLKALLAAGKKYIFCEKALVRTLADGEALLKLAEKSDARIMVGHHRRYSPGCARLRELIESGSLGKIRMAKVGYCHPGYIRQWGDFFADFERCGGVILDMMSHLFDLTNWYFGKAGTISGSSVMFDRSQPLPMDYVSGTIVYGDGVICNIDGSWQRHGVGYDRIEVYGDEACAIYDQGDKLHIYRKDEHTEISLPKSAAYAEQMKAFVSMIVDGTPPRTGLKEGFDSVNVALNMIEAAKKQETIHL